MNRLLLAFALLLPMLSAGQSAATIDTLHWSADRRLQLSDFHAPVQPGLGGSEFYYQIGYEVRPTSLWNRPAIDDFCLMFRNLSWVSETARTERTLAYNQVLFDLVEIHTRQMKAKLIALRPDRRFKQQARQIEYLTNAELGAEVNQFRAESGGGDDLPVLQRWQKQVQQRLYDVPDLITTYQRSKIGYGAFASGSALLPTGALAQTFRPSVGVAFGLDLAFRQTLLLLHPSLHNSTVQAGFSHQKQTWETGMPVQQRLLEIGLGQIIHDSPQSRLIPYVGYRLLELRPRDRNDERYKGYTLTDHAPTAGLILDVKPGNRARQIDQPGSSFWFIRTKLAYSPILNDKPFSGGHLTLQIGIGGFGRIRKATYRPERTVISTPGNVI